MLLIYLFIYLLSFCLARSRKERFTFGTTSTLWVWLKKTPTLSYQSCFPVYIGYPRITGTSKYRFLAFRSLFPRLGRGQGFLLLLSDILYLAGMGLEKMANNLVREPSKGLTGGGGGRSQSFARLTYFFALTPLSRPPQLRSPVPGYTPVVGPSLNLVATNHSGRKSRNKPIKAKVSLLSWRISGRVQLLFFAPPRK